MAELFLPLAELAARVPDGARVCLPKQYPFALLRELVRQGRRNLDVVAAPTGNFGVDFLVAAGVVRSVEAGAVQLGEFGAAANFNRAWENGAVEVIETSCPVIEAGLRAGAAGVTFTPVPGLLGSDLLAEREDFLVIADPYAPEFDVVLAPAIAPDVALIHGLRADRHGNVVCSIFNDERLISSAATTVLATVERIDEDVVGTIAGTEQVIPSIYFDGIAVVDRGAHPMGAEGLYEPDAVALRAYVDASRSAESMTAYLARVVLSASNEAEYRMQAGKEMTDA